MEWSFNNSQPIYSQLVQRLSLAIASGQLKPGERVMTVRDLALEAGVNPNTVQRALQELEREGLVYSQRGSGRFVTEDAAVISRTRAALASTQVASFRQAMEELGCTEEEIKTLLFGSKEVEDGKLS